MCSETEHFLPWSRQVFHFGTHAPYWNSDVFQNGTHHSRGTEMCSKMEQCVPKRNTSGKFPIAAEPMQACDDLCGKAQGRDVIGKMTLSRARTVALDPEGRCMPNLLDRRAPLRQGQVNPSRMAPRADQSPSQPAHSCPHVRQCRALRCLSAAAGRLLACLLQHAQNFSSWRCVLPLPWPMRTRGAQNIRARNS